MNKVDREHEPTPAPTNRRDVCTDGNEFRRHGDRSTHPKMSLNMQKLLEALQVSFLHHSSLFFFLFSHHYVNIVVVVVVFVIRIKYYNGCLFHTIQKDFTAQTGDPTGTGTAGDSIYK